MKFYDDLFAKFSDLDISILINNVGVMNMGNFDDQTVTEIKDTLDINVLPATMLSKKVLPAFLKRKTKSAIINVSSICGLGSMAGNTTYCASKAYLNFFTESIAYELKGRVDIECLMPGVTATKLAGAHGKSASAISPEDVVKGAFRDLGHDAMTGGVFSHDIQVPVVSFLVWLMPGLVNLFFLKVWWPMGMKKVD